MDTPVVLRRAIDLQKGDVIMCPSSINRGPLFAPVRATVHSIAVDVENQVVDLVCHESWSNAGSEWGRGSKGIHEHRVRFYSRDMVPVLHSESFVP